MCILNSLITLELILFVTIRTTLFIGFVYFIEKKKLTIKQHNTDHSKVYMQIELTAKLYLYIPSCIVLLDTICKSLQIQVCV